MNLAEGHSTELEGLHEAELASDSTAQAGSKSTPMSVLSTGARMRQLVKRRTVAAVDAAATAGGKLKGVGDVALERLLRQGQPERLEVHPNMSQLRPAPQDPFLPAVPHLAGIAQGGTSSQLDARMGEEGGGAISRAGVMAHVVTH